MLDAEYLPPAGHGDVLRAALRRPRAIALVDGVFETVPAVWHKEILFALSEGIHVYGAASMGALRAAELDRFGMRGVGAVYSAYADGTLEDDDEVAVAQADAEHGFRALSDAMVDVRATLAAAVADGIVAASAAEAIAARVKATFYPRRRLLGALDRADEEHERLRAWLPGGWVPRKRADALELLRVLGDDLLAGLEPFRPGWTLQRTRFWEEARRSVERAAAGRPTRFRFAPPTTSSRRCSTSTASSPTGTARCSSDRCSWRWRSTPRPPKESTSRPGPSRPLSTGSGCAGVSSSPGTPPSGSSNEA